MLHTLILLLIWYLRLSGCKKGSGLFQALDNRIFRSLSEILFKTTAQSSHIQTLNVGLLAEPSNSSLAKFFGWEQVAAGVAVAFDSFKERRLLLEYETLNLTWKNIGCKEAPTAGALVNYAKDGMTHVVLGPPCPKTAAIAGTIAGSYNFPIVLYGWPFSSRLTDDTQYPTILSSVSSADYPARSFVRILYRYGWNDVAILSYIQKKSDLNRCDMFFSEIEILIANEPNITVVYRQTVRDTEVATFRRALSPLKEVSRIVLVCLDADLALRNLMLAIKDEGMDSDEYVYFVHERRRRGFVAEPGLMIWQLNSSLPNDNRDVDALSAARRFIILDGDFQNRSATFKNDLLEKFKQPPFNCSNCTNSDVFASSVYNLAEAMLLFGYIMNRTLEKGLAPNGNNMAANAELSFDGFTGLVKINKNGTRIPTYAIYVLDENDKQQKIMTITEMVNSSFPHSENQITLLIQDTGLFHTHNRPICGYRRELCPPSFLQQHFGVIIAAVGTLLLLVLIIIAGTMYLIRMRHLEEDRLDLFWRVPYTYLLVATKRDLSRSRASFRSGTTEGTVTTVDSKKETESYCYCTFHGDSVVARKHYISGFILTAENRRMLRDMRNVDHDNICKFIGLSLDGPQVLSVWKYCSRGSIKDVIARSSLTMDQFFKYSLIRDIAEGIYYLHHFQFGAHGYISSGSCVINERWQVKLTFFGLDTIKMSEQRKEEGLLWTAPEHIRDPLLVPSKSGDIYSFAIVSSEIITRKSAWDLENQDYSLEDLIYKIKRGDARNLIRPSLDSDDEPNSSMLLLIKDCWSEDPGSRPNCDQIKTLIKSLNDSRSSNLMDHVFNILEQHASNLEDEVQIRLQELTEEKKKSDLLLYRMLPKQVADRLKTGQSVEPETFDCVTLFFSDVVSFTTIASRCTPLQVVNLLNDLYTTFDGIIDNHDVYKIETIGDGYFCVSGLPHRNGNEHAKEIAEMSKLLIRAVKTIRISHLPQDRIQIRVGLHTGSVVTGVVGLTMPRYCLFGDAVNTASRMESNGKPGRIHISTETMKFLTEVIGGYRTEPRGEVIVKGKGAVQTHWLLTEDDPGEQESSI